MSCASANHRQDSWSFTEISIPAGVELEHTFREHFHKYSEKKAQEVAPQLLSDTDKLPQLHSPKQIYFKNCPSNTLAEDSVSFFNDSTN